MLLNSGVKWGWAGLAAAVPAFICLFGVFGWVIGFLLLGSYHKIQVQRLM
jgi:hypothetical protein